MGQEQAAAGRVGGRRRQKAQAVSVGSVTTVDYSETSVERWLFDLICLASFVLQDKWDRYNFVHVTDPASGVVTNGLQLTNETNLSVDSVFATIVSHCK